MQVCVLYAAKTREGGKLADIAKAMAKGIESQGHRVDVVNMYEEGIRLTVYDYVSLRSYPSSLRMRGLSRGRGARRSSRAASGTEGPFRA